MSDGPTLERNVKSARVRLRFFAVCKYVDQIKVKFFFEKPEDDYQYWYFEVEDVAKRFIIDRAHMRVVQSKKNLQQAKARAKKCEKKFAVP